MTKRPMERVLATVSGVSIELMSETGSPFAIGSRLKLSWTGALDTLLQTAGATGGSLQVFDDSRGYGTRMLLRTRGQYDQVLTEYHAEQMPHDTQRKIFMRAGFVGTITDESIPDRRSKAEFDYLEWQRGICGVERFTTIAHRVGRHERVILSLHYAPGHGSLSSLDRDKLSRLLPGLKAAIARELREEEILLDGFWRGCTSHEERCAACVDDWGGILFASDSFAKLLNRCDLITVRNGRVSLRSERAERIYREALFDNWRGRTVSRLAPLLTPSEGRSVYLQMDSLPLAAKAVFGASPGLLLDVIDPAHSPRRVSLRAKTAFGLTAREAQLADTMLAGHSIESSAHLLSISVATARVHLANLTRKLGVGRQVDVIRVLSAW